MLNNFTKCIIKLVHLLGEITGHYKFIFDFELIGCIYPNCTKTRSAQICPPCPATAMLIKQYYYRL